MVDDTTGAEAPAEGIPAPGPSLPADAGPVNARDAAAAITAWRAKQTQPEPEGRSEQPRVNGRFSAATQESTPQGEDAAAAQQPPGEDQSDDTAEQPTIDPPRSWTKEDKEAFKLLPPDRQQSIVERERTRDAEIRRGQDDVANERKAIEAERQATLQARQQYESAAQNALSILQTQQTAEFGDIKTMADVQRMSEEDPFRYSKWDARQKMIEHQYREVQALEQRREQEKAETFKTWSKEQDDKFTKQFPEFADPEKGPKVRSGVISYLTKEIGVPEASLQKLYETDLFRDAMWQRVVYDASRFHAAQQSAKSAVQAPKPQVQRPGVAAPRGSQFQADIDAATARLKSSKGIEAARAAADLIAAKRKQAARH